MLIRAKRLQINPNSPFDGDQLDRQETANILTSLLSKVKTPLVVAIDSPWGTGKSTFLRMWKASLEKDGFSCLLFNAWDNDFTQDPLIALIGEINAQMEWAKIPKEYRSGAQKHWEKAKTVVGAFVRQAAP